MAEYAEERERVSNVMSHVGGLLKAPAWPLLVTDARLDGLVATDGSTIDGFVDAFS